MSKAGEPSGPPGLEGIDPTKSMMLAWQGQRGDAVAVNELLTRYMRRMLRVIRIKLGPWHRARIDPEDVLQETMMVATRRLPELQVRTPASIYQWLAKIADFKIKEQQGYLGAEKRDPAREQHVRDETDSSDSGIVVASAGPSPSQFLARGELEQRIDRCVEALVPSDFREVILMREYYEADWETIRVQLGRPSIAAVKDLHDRARKRLGERLRRDQDGEP
jgi:RNA polymerase sigma factor (sigma-70 family)